MRILFRPPLIPLAILAACGQNASSPAPDPFDSEERGGKLHNVEVASTSPDVLLTAAAADTGGDLDGLTMSDFAVVSTRSETTPSGQRLTHIRLRQEVDGVPVWKGYLGLTAREADAVGPARLLASSYRVFHGVRAATTPAIDEVRAVSLAREALRRPATAAVTDKSLVLWPLEGRLDLVWNVMVEGSHFRALVYATGPLEGRVLRVDTRHYETTGTVTGQVAIGGAADGNGVATPTPLADLDVVGEGATATTALDGSYLIDVAEGSALRASLAGAAVSVVDQTGLVTEATGTAAAVTDLSLGDAADPLSVAGVTTYHFANQIHRFLVDNGAGDPALLGLTANVNINDACNAFYTQNTLNFFQAGSVAGFNCTNSAEASIIIHEYGHFADDVFGGIQDAGLSEGWGDLLACLVRKTPEIGPDLFIGDDTAMRTCDNDYQFPASGIDQVHELGQAWAGFGWHAREGLIAALGEEEGDAVARQLLIPSLTSNAPDIPSAVREVFIRDDDDGDLENLTPHWDILLEAADRHHLGFVVVEDLVVPAATSDLAAAAVTATTVTLTWTAAGDDGDEGTADRFDLRVSREPITATNFAQAAPVAAPAPLEAGSTIEATVLVAPGETLFFALRTFDEQNNGSEISNVIEVTSDEGTEIFSDSFEGGAGGWQATGLWHVSERRASDGSSAFWYGQEATGNYDTGAANSGELLSPPIDLSGATNPALAFDTFFDVEAGEAFDTMRIQVFDVNDPEVAAEHVELAGQSGDFVGFLFSLDGFAGRTVQVRFSFDTVDNVGNTTEGWFIDHVRVVADGEAGTPSLVINELLADPGPFDANGDGLISFSDDEFIELVNAGSTPLDLSGATVEDAMRVRFTFPEGTTLAPGTALVLFGGGTPPPGMNALIANGLFLNNRGDRIIVRAPGGATLADMSYGNEGSDDQSLTRAVDGDGEAAFVKHRTVSSAPASPGTRADGTPFDVEPPTPASLVINEVLADPAPGFDANRDGVASTSADEFIEIVNVGGEPIDLSGATLADAVSVRAIVPDGVVLEPGGALVLFGGGSPDPADFPGVQVAAGGSSLFLNNSGDTIVLSAAGGGVLAALSFGLVSDQSLVRQTELDGTSALVPHTEVSDQLASPGTRADGSAR